LQRIAFILVSALLLSCFALNVFFKRKSKSVAWANRIDITGNTQNIKGHAAVVAENTGIFFVDGVDAWEESWVNRKVKVTGDLEVIGKESFGKEEPERQIKIIKSAVVLLKAGE
jgi:hypothetical protein